MAVRPSSWGFDSIADRPDLLTEGTYSRRAGFRCGVVPPAAVFTRHSHIGTVARFLGSVREIRTRIGDSRVGSGFFGIVSVASTLVTNNAARGGPTGFPDEFLAAGALPTLHDRYGPFTDRIVKRVLRALG